MPKTISIIVAIAEDYGIGYENKLLAHLSADLKRFKQITKGHPVVMGRNTWFSLPNRPLPNRKNIVITNISGEVFEGAETVYSVEEAIERMPENEESFIIGGAMIYKQFFSIAHKLYLTRMHKTFVADTFFPQVHLSEWELLESTEINDDSQVGFPYSYMIYSRK